MEGHDGYVLDRIGVVAMSHLDVYILVPMLLVHLLREARLRAGLTQAELAQRAGVAQSTIGRIEADARVPSVARIERLIAAARLELRVGLGERDEATDSLFERSLARSPRERLADTQRAARFALRAREALRGPVRG